MKNWIDDLDGILTPWPPGAAAGCPHCKVHAGFLSTYTALQPQLLPLVQQLVQQHPTAPIWVTGRQSGWVGGWVGGWLPFAFSSFLVSSSSQPPTASAFPSSYLLLQPPTHPPTYSNLGHSLGAALAVLCTLDLFLFSGGGGGGGGGGGEEGETIVFSVQQAITYGQPRVGNKEVRLSHPPTHPPTYVPTSSIKTSTHPPTRPPTQTAGLFLRQSNAGPSSPVLSPRAPQRPRSPPPPTVRIQPTHPPTHLPTYTLNPPTHPPTHPPPFLRSLLYRRRLLPYALTHSPTHPPTHPKGPSPFIILPTKPFIQKTSPPI